MRTIKLLAAIFFITSFGGYAYAGSDRFGNEVDPIYRSSFTASADPGVLLASAPITYDQSGGLILRSVHCSGVVASTITFYNAQHFAVNQSTKDVFSYIPTNPTAVITPFPSQIFYDSYYSSGIAYIKTGAAPCGIRWDYSVKPGRHGDSRD